MSKFDSWSPSDKEHGHSGGGFPQPRAVLKQFRPCMKCRLALPSLTEKQADFLLKKGRSSSVQCQPSLAVLTPDKGGTWTLTKSVFSGMSPSPEKLDPMSTSNPAMTPLPGSDTCTRPDLLISYPTYVEHIKSGHLSEIL